MPNVVDKMHLSSISADVGGAENAGQENDGPN